MPESFGPARREIRHLIQFNHCECRGQRPHHDRVQPRTFETHPGLTPWNAEALCPGSEVRFFPPSAFSVNHEEQAYSSTAESHRGIDEFLLSVSVSPKL